MKNIFKYGLMALGAYLLAGCQPEIESPDQKRLPVASELTADIRVDQTTNIVTFSILDKDVVPVWIFGEELIDGKANKKYSYVQNGLQLRIRDAGEHTVELRAYNANGISQGSQTVRYTLENTYRDPFDATPYMKAIANQWVWDQANAGHFGCGETADNPTGWWSCGANEKEGKGLYDDIMTFTADGSYTYNPGEGGTVYVNKDVTALGGSGSTEDYEIPIDEFTCTYTIENNWNDAGIEEIYLVLPEGKNLSYVPNNDAVGSNARYLFVNTKTSDIKKNLKLVNYSPTANGGNSIAWLYSFVPYVKTATAEELLAGTTSEGKAWIMDAAAKGHLACGPSLEDPTGWWPAGPYEKEGFGLYDNVLTFYPDGKYVFDSGEDGQIYVNKDVTALGGPAGEDFVVTWEDQESSYVFDGETITLPEGVVIGYVPNDESYSNPVFHVTSISETSLVLVSVTEGISWQYIFKARDIEAPSQTIGGVAVEGGKVELTLSQGEDIAVTGIDLSALWIDPDFFEMKDASTLKFLATGGDYRIYVLNEWLKVIPLSGDSAATYDNGGAIWMIGDGYGKPQGTIVGWNTGESVDLPMARISDNEYRLTLYFSPDKAGENPSFKLFGQPDWDKEFVSTDYDSVEGNGLFAIGTGDDGHDNGNIYSLTGEAGWYVFTVKDNGGTLSITMDKKRETWFDLDGETNLWRSATITPDYWYADSNWGLIDSPEGEITENNGFSVTVPEGVGGTEWQGQNKLLSTVPIEAGQEYDFCCTIEADAEMTITVKLAAEPGNDKDENKLYYNNAVSLGESEPLTLKLEKVSANPPEGTTFMLIFDFGRSPAGSRVDVTDICFQKHKEQ